MSHVWALVPVKPLAQAKSRLAPLLSQCERAALARCMMRDVLAALRSTQAFAGIALLTADRTIAAETAEFACRVLTDDTRQDLSVNLDVAAGRLAAKGAETVVIVPADLPCLSGEDVSALLGAHAHGVTVVPAAMDGGTNGLAMTPPDAGQCHFGPDSARRHLAAARLRGFAAALLPLPGFARDMDTVDDVLWLCRRPGASQTRRYLDESGICARVLRSDRVALN
jgi:2-phospho-L-lactate guanylyltransferase